MAIRRYLAGLTALTLLHGCGLIMLFEPMSSLFDGEPLVEQDYSLHYHHLVSAREIWREDGRLWGYNPMFMAGYPSGTIQDASVKLLLYLAMPFGDGLRAFKWLVFG